jgi:hypothetical protein
MAYVYIYFDPRKTPPEPIYVGKGNNERLYDHLFNSSNNILSSKISKIKELGLEPIIEKYIDDINEDEAYEIEKQLIKKIGKIVDNNGTLCNYCNGGKGGRLGFKHSKKTIELFSEQRKGKKQTKNQYLVNCNRVVTEETKERIRNKLKNRKRSPESIEKGRLKNIGKKRSDETKKMFSEQRKGKKQSLEHIMKAKIARKKSFIRKKIKCIETDKVYDSVTDASIDLGLRESSITSVANGNRKQHKGFHFIYIT